MKYLTIFLIILIPQILFAQSDICQKVYVWPFSDANGKFAIEATQLTNEVEEALTQANNCVVLQRRDYASLFSQLENESEIQSVEGMSKSTSQELETIKAKTVLFGSVEKDFSGTIRLQVSFQNLNNKQILLQNSIFLMGAEAMDLFKRKEKIRQFITACVNPDAFNEERNWNEVVNIDTREAYQGYLEKYPAGVYRSLAERVLKDETLWNEILNEKKDNKQIKLLEDYRDAQFERHNKEANSMLGGLLYRKGEYKKYLDLFPDGEYAAEANTELEKRKQKWDDGIRVVAETLPEIVNSENGSQVESKPENSPPPKYNQPENGLQGGTYTIQQKNTGRYVDAHEATKDFALVTRPAQNNSSQQWILTPLGNNIYTIQQKSTGRYVDAHQNATNDFGLATRPPQNNSSQQWILIPLGNNTYTIQQKSTSRFVDAYETTKDFALVTRVSQNNSSQQWIIKRR